MGLFRKAYMQQITLSENNSDNRHPIGIYKPKPAGMQEEYELTKGETIVKYGVAGIGVTCTIFALYGIIRNSVRGEVRNAQKYMRYRLIAQFFTVSAVSACLMYFALKRREAGHASQNTNTANGDAQAAHH